jgi:hypothetical protein
MDATIRCMHYLRGLSKAISSMDGFRLCYDGVFQVENDPICNSSLYIILSEHEVVVPITMTLRISYMTYNFAQGDVS